jgi:hypothetical protein
MRDSVPRGEGERQETARRRKRWMIIGALFVAGLGPGFYLGSLDAGPVEALRTVTWPPGLVAMFLALHLGAVVGGGLLLSKQADELDRERGYKSVSFAGTLLMIVYPAWYVLWRGGFVPEPIHWVLFLLFWLSLILAAIFYRFR